MNYIKEKKIVSKSDENLKMFGQTISKENTLRETTIYEFEDADICAKKLWVYHECKFIQTCEYLGHECIQLEYNKNTNMTYIISDIALINNGKFAYITSKVSDYDEKSVTVLIATDDKFNIFQV